MDRSEEASLLGELRDLARKKQCFLDDAAATNPVAKYTSAERFAAEREKLFLDQPRIVAHASELPAADDFLRREVTGLPLLLTRDGDAVVHAFLNVCRHRGARLVDEESGCRNRFSCPYHAWTYDNRGALLRVPFGDDGFPGLDKSGLGLRALACEERSGWIWVRPAAGEMDLDAYLGDLPADLAWLEGETLEIKEQTTVERRANWKILIEGGIEAYHFRVVHRNTIGPHFPDNLSSYRRFGDNLRSILPRAGIADSDPERMEDTSIRDHANVLYTFFPLSNLLVMPDHLVWIDNEPLAPDRTRLRVRTLAPRSSTDSEHWARNHAITTATLAEDGEVAESVQSGLHTGANESLLFGRFEGALAVFNASADRHLGAD